VTSLEGLPAVPRTAIPQRIREQGTGAEQAYRVALGFERELLSQLTKALQTSTAEDEGGDAAATAYRDQLPGAMADAVTAAGGTGLAEGLYRALRPEAS
jgi:Rod binding domain-containing protein